MKKIILSSIFAVALIATVGFGVNKSMKSDTNLSDLALANVEALADGESGSGNTVDCYSESDYKSGSTYYDCGSCKKEENSKGKGNKRTCTT